MNRPLFDPKHLRIAAEVREKAWRRRWLNRAAGLMLLLLLLIGVVLPVFLAAHLLLLLAQW